jgi:hypothetical protein
MARLAARNEWAGLPLMLMDLLKDNAGKTLVW